MEDWGDLAERYVVIGKMLTKWIQQLAKDDRRVRG